MPVLRYFVFVGLALLGCLFAADYFMPREAAVAGESDDTLANWRASEARKSVHARSAATNNFTQSYAMFAPAPAFGLSLYGEAVLDARLALDASASVDSKTDTKVAAVKPQDTVRADASRKPRRHQIAQTTTAGRSTLPPPSADSLRQDMMARTAQQRQGFAQPQWPQPGFREANAGMQNPFGPRMW